MCFTKVAIITEGTEETGFGHIFRCSSLYEAFLDAGDDPFFLINGNASILSIVRSYKHEILNWLEHRDRCKAIVHGCDIVIVDSYLAGLDFYAEIVRIAPVNVFIDDNKRIDFPEGIILNGAIYAFDLGYPEKWKGSNLLGPAFFLLRKPFQARKKKEIRKDIESMMVFFGATDVRNMSLKIIEYLVKEFPGIKKMVVVGPGFLIPKDFNKKMFSSVKVHKNLDASGMLSLMLEADIAISACGTSLYELACIGIPTIGIGVADNQKYNIEGFSRLGFLKFAGWWNDPSLLPGLKKCIESLRDPGVRVAMSSSGRNMVKGDGATRVVQHLTLAWYKKMLVFTRATRDNCELYFNWANDDETRKNSFTSVKIPYDAHVKWFTSKLDSPSSFLFVGSIKGQPVGQLRVDVEDLKGAISFSVGKEWRGKGLGTMFLQGTPDLVMQYGIKIQTLIGRVKYTNLASQKAFERAGFCRVDEKEHVEYFLDVK